MPAEEQRLGAAQRVHLALRADSQAGVDDLLAYIKRVAGINFAAYKRPSLLRRLELRLQAVGAADAASYQSFLRTHPNEMATLLDTLLINVTSFFRDPPSWQGLMEAIPRLREGRQEGEPLRVWSAGCASGREAYSLAMALAEALGMEEFRRRVKIYATDLDQSEIDYARRASYSERETLSIPPALRAKYFERQGARFLCGKDLRRAVIFARHDLLRDAPISRIDLLCCRNTLMYFNAQGQAQALAKLHFAVRGGGLLFLGKSEMLAAYGSLFKPLDLKRRIFVKVPQSGERERRLPPEAQQKEIRVDPMPANKQTMMQNMALDGGSLAQVLVNQGGVVTMINEQARALFGLSAQDVGRSLHDMELSYRPAELRSLISRAQSEKQSMFLRDVPWLAAPDAASLSLDVSVVPLLDGDQNSLGTAITFADVTPQKQVQSDLQATIRELEVAYEELQSTNEELETTYEELQSTIEELDTTNEELQSTNEELETMNEELQFTNEELQTINGEVSQRGDALDEANAFMQSILRSFQAGVAVLSEDLLVQVWNSKMEDLWGLRAEEAQGNHFWNLDIGLPVERLKQPLRAILGGQQGDETLTLNAHNRRGREIVCQVTCMPLLGAGGERRGVILLMEQTAPALSTSDGTRASLEADA